jgi:hypothetical protein
MMNQKLYNPTPISVNRAQNVLLNGAYWPEKIEAMQTYSRRHDDTDGLRTAEQYLSVTIGVDGDAWLQVGIDSLRFRTYFGGGMSLNTRNALLLLVEALRRDNEISPQN